MKLLHFNVCKQSNDDDNIVMCIKMNECRDKQYGQYYYYTKKSLTTAQ